MLNAQLIKINIQEPYIRVRRNFSVDFRILFCFVCLFGCLKIMDSFGFLLLHHSFLNINALDSKSIKNEIQVSFLFWLSFDFGWFLFFFSIGSNYQTHNKNFTKLSWTTKANKTLILNATRILYFVHKTNEL